MLGQRDKIDFNFREILLGTPVALLFFYIFFGQSLIATTSQIISFLSLIIQNKVFIFGSLIVVGVVGWFLAGKYIVGLVLSPKPGFRVNKSEGITILLELLDERRHHLLEKQYLKIFSWTNRVWPFTRLPIYKLLTILVTLGTIFWLFMGEVGRLRTFVDHFPVHQVKEYFLSSGSINFIIIGASIIIIFKLFLSKKKFYRIPAIFAVFLVGSLLARTVYLNVSNSKINSVEILSVKPNEVTEAWTDVTITGRNFKDVYFPDSVFVHGVGNKIIKWSNNEIIFRTNPAKTVSGKLYVKDIDGKTSNQVDFYYSPRLN